MRNLQKNLIPKWNSGNKISDLIEELPTLCNNFEYQIGKSLLPNLGEYSINSYVYDINDFFRNPNNKCFKITVPVKNEDDKTIFHNRYFVITSTTFIILEVVNERYRNMCKINGRMVTVNELKEFMKNFIEIHGQNDNQNLLDNKKHLGYLDGFSGNELKELTDEYKKLYNKYNEIKRELKANYGDEKEKQRKLDLLQYQINEIEEANLKQNEDKELEEKRKIMHNSEKINESLRTS